MPRRRRRAGLQDVAAASDPPENPHRRTRRCFRIDRWVKTRQTACLSDRPPSTSRRFSPADLTESHRVGPALKVGSTAVAVLVGGLAQRPSKGPNLRHRLRCGLQTACPRGLPHVGGVALEGTPTVNRVLAEVAEVVRRRTELFRNCASVSMAAYRRMVAMARPPTTASEMFCWSSTDGTSSASPTLTTWTAWPA